MCYHIWAWRLTLSYLSIAIECAQHDSAPVWCDHVQSCSSARDYRWDEVDGGDSSSATSATSSPGRVRVFAQNRRRSWCQLAWRRSWASVSNYSLPSRSYSFSLSSVSLIHLIFVFKLDVVPKCVLAFSSGQVSMCQLSSALFHPVLTSVSPLFLKTHSSKTLSTFNVHTHAHTHWTERSIRLHYHISLCHALLLL